jgi:phage FluMu gp28-like protein
VEDRGGLAEGLLRSADIQFVNGSRIIAIPANPATARGYSANINLDEFAYHEDPKAIWAALFPATSNQLAGTFLDRFRAMIKGESVAGIIRKLKVRVVSTFNGRNNKFFELWERAKQNGYSAHKVTIHDAIADGMPLDAEKLRAALDDPDAWAQEYECEPMDVSTVLLPYELIAACESNEASIVVSPEFFRSGRRLVAGIDFGRRRDLTVCWVDELIGNLAICRAVITLEKMPTPEQVEILTPIIRACERVALDYTGPGIGFGDYLVQPERGLLEYNPEAHQHGKIELVTFGNLLKNEICSKLRMSFERRDRQIPINRTIRESLHSVQRVVTANGNISYRAPHTEDGHADEFTALALSERARSGKRNLGTFEII